MASPALAHPVARPGRASIAAAGVVGPLSCKLLRKIRESVPGTGAGMGSSGHHGEAIAAHYLALRGYTLLARNARCSDVEVDLLARDGDCLVLVEVKLRTHRVVRARDAVAPQQERRLLRAASTLLARHDWAEQVRLDLVAIDHDRNGECLHLEHLRGVLPR